MNSVRASVHVATAIKETSGKPPRGWYYGMVATKAGARSRALVAQVFREEGLPLKYYSDDYSDDLPHWVPMPGGDKNEGLLIIPCERIDLMYQAYAHPDATG